MQYIYSPSTNAFYAISLQAEYKQAGSWPTDGVEIDDKTYQEFSGIAPAGKIRGANKKGEPCWVDLPPPPAEQQQANAESQKSALLTAANNIIALLQDAVDLEMATEEEVAQLKEWKQYRVLLNRVDIAAENVEWPDQPSD